jgi:hypothetical protein
MEDIMAEEQEIETVENSRRGFLKKSAYSVPTIVGLGALLTLEDLSAYAEDEPMDGKKHKWKKKFGSGNNHGSKNKNSKCIARRKRRIRRRIRRLKRRLRRLNRQS